MKPSKFHIPKCPRCKRATAVTIVDRYEPGHIHYACQGTSFKKPRISGDGCGTTWRERRGVVVKSSIEPALQKRRKI